MEKIVIQKMQDDGSYIEEHPRTSQEMVINLLNSSTKSLMGLSDSSTADDAFKQLYLANVLNGKSMVELTFLDSVSGKPISDIIVTCDKFCDAAGTALTQHITDSNGKITAFVSAINPTVKVTGYADIENFSQQLNVPTLGKQFVFKFNLTTNQFKSYLSSQKIKFSKNVTKIDFSCCGGGRGGTSGGGTSHTQICCGGAGGYGVQKTGVIPTAEQSYSITVGSGGTFATRDVAGTGGTSTFMGVSAAGGAGGEMNGSSAAIGNGNGGYGSRGYPPVKYAGGNGTQKIFSGFNQESLCGGGGAVYYWYDEDSSYNSYGTAGSPGGGKSKKGTDGLGGGGSGMRADTNDGYNGGKGSVNICMYLASRS